MKKLLLPPLLLGLCVALEMLCADSAANLGIAVHQHLTSVPLDKDAELTVYRLVQESLTNISKYAQASEVVVKLETVGHLARITVQDNGRGFERAAVPPGHHGLLGMRVRVESHAGTFLIHSAPGRGTLIRAELPLSQPLTQPLADAAA